QRGAVPAFLAVAAAAAEFQVEPVREQSRQRAQSCQRGVAALVQCDPCDLAVAPEQGDQAAAGIALQPAGIDQRPAAVLALLPGTRDQSRQVEIAVAVLAQQGESPWPRIVESTSEYSLCRCRWVKLTVMRIYARYSRRLPGAACSGKIDLCEVCAKRAVIPPAAANQWAASAFGPGSGSLSRPLISATRLSSMSSP